MILLELTHTSHTAAATGIQQVCRNLHAELLKAGSCRALVRDPWQNCWRLARGKETARALPDTDAGAAFRKGESWNVLEKLAGRLRLLAGIRGPMPGRANAVIFPEFTMARCHDALAELRGLLQPRCPFVAVFHDAIALRYPELSARATVERFPAYLRALAGFDAVAAVSDASRDELLERWKELGVAKQPPVVTIPLGTTLPENPPARRVGNDEPLRVLCVATLEPRKNHKALLAAAETLWREGVRFRLDLVGMEHRSLGAPIVAQIHLLQEAGWPLFWHGAVDAGELDRFYRECDFTVYPSLMEGFGLPVLESVAYKKPCLCTPCGALAEVAQGGGCLVLSGSGECDIALGLRSLIGGPMLGELYAEVARRRVRTWADYARDLAEFATEASWRD
jgi:glycosyltransferase involved in cell wall biosynthesis